MYEKIKIEKKIPIPEYVGKRGRPSKYPWDIMAVGDSFLFPKGIKHSSAYQTAGHASKSYERKFVVRKTKEGYRCWRVK